MALVFMVAPQGFNGSGIEPRRLGFASMELIRSPPGIPSVSETGAG
jgi:hypothetical protein